MSTNTLGQDNKRTPAFEDTDKMPFGKFKGEPLQDVPAKYLAWLWNDGVKDYSFNGITNSAFGDKQKLANYIWNSRNALNHELGSVEIK